MIATSNWGFFSRSSGPPVSTFTCESAARAFSRNAFPALTSRTLSGRGAGRMARAWLSAARSSSTAMVALRMPPSLSTKGKTRERLSSGVSVTRSVLMGRPASVSVRSNDTVSVL